MEEIPLWKSFSRPATIEGCRYIELFAVVRTSSIGNGSRKEPRKVASNIQHSKRQARPMKLRALCNKISLRARCCFGDDTQELEYRGIRDPELLDRLSFWHLGWKRCDAEMELIKYIASGKACIRNERHIIIHMCPP